MERSSFCPARHWGKKEITKDASRQRGIADSGEGGTEVSGFQKPPHKMPGEVYNAMKGLGKPERAVFSFPVPAVCTQHPLTVEEDIPKDQREIQSPGSWGRDHTTGQECFTSETTNPGPSLQLKSHLWKV